MRVLAEANGLTSPYRIQVGRTLTIPEAGQPRAPAPLSVAALPSTEPSAAAPPLTKLDNPVSAPSGATSVQAAPLPPVVSPATEAKGEAATPTTNSSAIVPPPAAPSFTAPAPPTAPDPPASHSGNTFSWPVRGRILAAYGSSSDGTHNDGINIGAPRGAPVQAADAGVVAYTGNELRGYGNLILIKHADGWISAYAHCDQLLVKRGDKVARGQVIARVGATGNVNEPQLHFELRHGRQAVDPREFLTPLPTAATRDSRSG
jgi:murein DD-endopeptidase MepM/ murein hydrolase activator NlpD